jgi:hypothetical protein
MLGHWLSAAASSVNFNQPLPVEISMIIEITLPGLLYLLVGVACGKLMCLAAPAAFRWGRTEIRRLFCRHADAEFIRNIYGDEIIASDYKRSIWHCSACGLQVFRDDLYTPDPSQPCR